MYNIKLLIVRVLQSCNFLSFIFYFYTNIIFHMKISKMFLTTCPNILTLRVYATSLNLVEEITNN